MPERWSENTVAILTGMMGLVSLTSVFPTSLANHFQLLQKYSPLSVQHGSGVVVILTGITLLILAVGIWQRSHLAWWLTLIVLSVAIIGQLLLGFHYGEAD